MGKTITVKGIGRASAKADYVVISFELESCKHDYDDAMELAASNIELLNQALTSVGFEKDAVKTTNFNVSTDYKRIQDGKGNYRQVFNGYVVSHNLKIEFDFDMDRLSKTLSVMASCKAHPQISINFTVKDAAAVSEVMLRNAAENAKRKAEILCSASGVSLGDLIAIDYNWGELDFYSDTQYRLAEDCIAAPMGAKPIDMEPDDIDVRDTATFVWEIN